MKPKIADAAFFVLISTVMFAAFATIIGANAFATFAQTYGQELKSSGSSTIVNTMDVSLFSAQLNQDALTKMDAVCKAGKIKVPCSVDVAGKKITMTEGLVPGDYYSFKADYGFPFITYNFELTRLPTDRFSKDLESLMVTANVINVSGNAAQSPIDLKLDNSALAAYLKAIKAQVTYKVKMPGSVESASSGQYSAAITGSNAEFDVVQVMVGGANTIKVTSKEPNLGYFAAILAIVVLVALAASFFVSKPKSAKTRIDRAESKSGRKAKK